MTTNWVVNVCGIRVKRCCASCAYRELTRALTTRVCQREERTVTPGDGCGHWMMGRLLMSAGRVQGRVKCRDYLMHILGVREEEAKAEEAGKAVKARSVEEIREEYEREHGSVYLDI